MVGAVEQVTVLYLLPRHTHSGERLLGEVTGLVEELREAAHALSEGHQAYAAVIQELQEQAEGVGQRLNPAMEDLGHVRRLLAKGFRLNDPGADVRDQTDE